MIVILDYGIGNLASIKNMLKKCGVDSIITKERSDIKDATKFILPGIGSFDHGIKNLRAASYFELLEDMVLNKKTPVLGVCLGMQMMASSSEEGSLPGLNWISGKVVRFNNRYMEEESLKIPHMGWAETKMKKNSVLFNDMYSDARFYFVHSYHWKCDILADELLSSEYGYEFTAAIERENIAGVQFHPEKSHKYGLKLYENFIKYF